MPHCLLWSQLNWIITSLNWNQLIFPIVFYEQERNHPAARENYKILSKEKLKCSVVSYHGTPVACEDALAGNAGIMTSLWHVCYRGIARWPEATRLEVVFGGCNLHCERGGRHKAQQVLLLHPHHSPWTPRLVQDCVILGRVAFIVRKPLKEECWMWEHARSRGWGSIHPKDSPQII